MSRYNVLYLTSELYPFAKVGGLADVAGTLPKVLKEQEHDIRVFLPKYKVIRDRKYNLREVIRLRDIEVPLGDQTFTVSVKSGFVPDSKVQAYFLEYKPFFDRADIYIDPKTGEGWKDDALRFALFSKAALETLKVLFWQPDLVHVNDWPGALAPYYLKTAYKDDPFFENTRSVMTIHNVAYQGSFPAEVAKDVFPETEKFDKNHPGFLDGKVNFLKAGIESADLLTTVSPTYAKEIISSKELGAGLNDVLKKKKAHLFGVLNGIDDTVWNPETDKHIAENYSVDEMDGKAACRAALIEEMGLENPENMVIGMISRLVEQKGFDLVRDAAEELLKLPVNLVILGSGQKDIQADLEKLAEDNPGRVAVKIDFDDALAHKIEAGADAFLMPSRYEPCGLNQMYSLRYGTPPIVRSTGGLADTVKEYTVKKGEGNGFLFKNAAEKDLVAAVKKATTVFKNAEAWKKLQHNGMVVDYSWSSSAKMLISVFDQAMEEAVA
ncbi:glycogen synthase GlgA [bacterium]|nr:glycogen synthase GlgA [bacterium]